MSLESKGKPEAKEEVTESQVSPTNDLNEEEELDLTLAVKMAKKLINEKGLEVIQSALKESQDAASVIGQFFAQLFAQMHESFPKDLEISPRIYLCKGGVLEQMLDYIEEKLKLPREFSDQVFGAVVETIKGAAQDPPEGDPAQQGQPPQPGAPAPAEAMPQPAAPPMGVG